MDPNTHYHLAEFRQKEALTQFERYPRYPLSTPDHSGWPPPYRFIVGLGSLILGVLMIVQQISG